MQNKKGISLIVLVITIIIMIILASAIIISLNNTGIINMSNKAIAANNKQQINALAQMLWAEEYMESEGKVNRSKIESKIEQELEKQGVNLDNYLIKATDSGVEIKEVDNINWEFAYTYTRETDLWSGKLTKEDGELTGDIIVKFYKTGEKVNPPEEAIADFLGVPVIFEENDAYRMVIEGTGDMGILLTSDMTTANAWQQETVLYVMGQLGEGAVPVIPYVTDVVIEEGVTNISLNAFTGASSLTTVYNGKGIEEISETAFGFCENLNSITIPSSLKKVGINAFTNCTKLTNIHVESLEAWNNTVIIGYWNKNLVDAKVTYDYRTEVERLANEGWQKAYEKGNTTASKLQTEVETYLQNNNVSESELELYEITATTKGVEVTSKETTLGNIIKDGADYGKTVNYSANGVNNWKVLYKQTIDGQDYVYLIASENIPNSSMPTNIPGAKFNGKNIYWEWNYAPTEQASIERETLWMANWSDYNANPNGRVASQFLSEQYWTSFKNPKYGENVVGAIGTPTAEMLTASYNARSTAIGDTGTNSTLTLTNGDYGYYINEDYWVELSRLDKLYTGSPKAEEYTWVASPSDGNPSFLVGLNYRGSVDYYYYDGTNLGVRPLVCLKSSIPASVGLLGDGADIILK